MISLRVFILFFAIVQIRGEKLEKESYDLNGIIGNLFPNLQAGAARNPTANYPGALTNYPINGQTNNPQGNIWNNGNGNPGVNYPANSQYYPGNGIQRWPQYHGNPNNWNNPGYPSGIPPNGMQTRPPYPGVGGNWNGANPTLNQPPNMQSYPGGQFQGRPQYPGSGNYVNGVNQPPNTHMYPGGKIQGGTYPGAGFYGQNPNVNYQYPDNVKLQKLNPRYPGARNNWNNGAFNPNINYPGNPQSYPLDGIQNPSAGLQNWNPGYSNQNFQRPGQSNPMASNAIARGYPNQGQTFWQQPGYGRPAQDPFYSGFRNEAPQSPNQSVQASIGTDKPAISENPKKVSKMISPS